MHPELGREIAERLRRAAPKERGSIVGGYAGLYGVSRSKVYRIAAEHGFSSGRKERADRGAIKGNLTEADLKLMAGMQKKTRRKNKTMLMPTTAAVRLANRARKLTGEETIQASPATVNRHLRRLGISRKDMLRNWTTDDHATPAFCMPLKAEFVNEWHVFDITPCIQYYFKPKKGLAQHDQNLELYPGKLENFKKIGKHLHRYVLIDIKSQVYFFKYYNSAGEKLADLLDFLYSAWSFKEGFPFSGVPFNLYADKGAANKSHFLGSVAERLEIRLDHHKAGNSRAKGIVEERMKYLQEHFEAELAFNHAPDLETINRWAFDFCVTDNSSFVHSRMKTTRLSVWASLIRPEHKRILDCTLGDFLGLAASRPARACVSRYRTIKFNGEEYLVHGPVNKGEWVLADYNYMDRSSIRVWKMDAEGNRAEQIPVTLVKRNRLGEREDAVNIGKEYRRLEDAPIQTAMKEMDGLDYSRIAEAAFRYDLEDKEKVGFMEKPGTPIFAPAAEEAAPATWPRHEVFAEVRHRLKAERLTTLEAQLIEKMLGSAEIVGDEAIEAICRRLTGGGKGPETGDAEVKEAMER